MVAPPPLWVSSPPAEPPIVGLIASLSGPYLDPAPTLDRINTPIRYSPEQVCSNGDVTDPCNPSTFDVPANPDVVEATPFLIRAGEQCSTFGFEARDYTGRATRALIAVESKLIADELWTGTQAQDSDWTNPYLASPDSDVLSNGPVSPTVALECLEHGLALCGNGQRGMIHCTRELASRWSSLGAVYRQTAGGLLQTFVGTIIVPDAGYDGSAPDGDPAVDGSQWAYATGMVTVRRGPISIDPESLEAATYKKEDTVRYVASRLATASFDPCCLLAVEVDLPLCLIGGAS